MLTPPVLHTECSTISVRIEELNDLGNGGVGLVHGSLEFAVGLEFGVGSAAEQVVGQWTAQTLMEEDEDDRDLVPLSARR